MSRHKAFWGTVAVFFLMLGSLVVSTPPTPIAVSVNTVEELIPAPMPIHRPSTVSNYIGSAPVPNRDESVRKWMAPSLRIRNGGASGSGTICHYDAEKNVAWVISCAHLFRSQSEKSCTVETFYHNDVKLPAPKRYTAEVVAVKINGYGDDISILKFTPDWQPNYFRIAKSYEYRSGEKLYSTGCDRAEEVACYFVKVVGIQGAFLTTRENSPRPGRSGGGLMTEDGKYVGICVRTSDVSGNGEGYFVHVNTISSFLGSNNLSWLLDVPESSGGLLRRIPIIDRLGPQRQYPPNYVPVP